jgi:plastocyanin
MVIRRIALLAALLFAWSVPAQAAVTTHAITVQYPAFTPKFLTVVQGDSVRWNFVDATITHTTTSNQGFWDSGDRTFGQHYTKTFYFAGGFGYHCMHHPTLMTGRITVPLRVSGTPSTGYTIRWSAALTTPSNRSFDLEVLRPGSTTWAYLRKNTTTRSMHYNPTRNGTYKLRARTDNRTLGVSSGWTPVRSVTIS